MAIDPSEIEKFGYSVETHVYDEISARLGSKAAELFLNQLPVDPMQRTKALAHQAIVFSMLTPYVDEPEQQETAETVANTESADVVHLADHAHHGVVSQAETDHDEHVVIDLPTVAKLANEFDDCGAEGLPAIEVFDNSDQAKPNSEVDKWEPSKRLSIFTDGIVRQHGGTERLGLTYTDKDTFVGAILALRGKTKTSKKSIPAVKEVLEAMYDGDTRAQSAERFKTTAVTIGNRLSFLQINIDKNVDRSSINPYAFIEEQLRIARGEMIANPVDSTDSTAHSSFYAEAISQVSETEKSELNDSDIKHHEAMQSSMDVYHYPDASQYSVNVEEASPEISKIPQPAISEKRRTQITSMNNYELHSALVDYFKENMSQSDARSVSRLLDMQSSGYVEVDYAFGRAAIRRLIESDQGQAVYESLADSEKNLLGLLADYDLKRGEKPQTLKQIIDGVDSWKRKDAKRTLFASLNSMLPYQDNEDEGVKTESFSATDVYVPRMIVENLNLSEDIDLYHLALNREVLKQEELEGGINSLFARAVEAGIFSETQAAYLRRRLKGSDEIEERAQDEKSATIVFGQVVDRFATRLYKSSGSANNEMPQVLRGLLAQFRQNKTLAHMESVVLEAQSAKRQNAFKVITVEDVPLTLAGAVSSVIELAIEKTQR